MVLGLIWIDMTREDIQNELADYCRELRLDEVYGVLTDKRINEKGRSVRTVTFCKARTLDGLIEIYGPTFIRITSNYTYPTIAKSLGEAKGFLKEFFTN